MKMDVREAYFHVKGFVQGLILKQAESNSEIAIAYTDDANQFRKFATAGQEGRGLCTRFLTAMKPQAFHVCLERVVRVIVPK